MPKNDDDKVWSAYAKGVRRTKKKATLPLREGGICVANSGRGQKPDPSPAKAKDLLRKSKLSLPGPQGERETLFDRKTERAWREGDIVIEGKLDLHGMTQSVAHAALIRFLEKQMKTGNRNLLIITGKGAGKNGVLRSNLAGWLEALPVAQHIRILRHASLKHGGDGAFYLILKRDKE